MADTRTELQKRFVDRLRRNGLLRAMGHNPAAVSCMWAEPWDFTIRKAVCKPCQELRRKYPYL